MNAEEIVQLLKSARIPYSTELEMQEAIVKLLEEVGVSYQREYILSKKDRVDFFIEGGIAVECKVKGQPLAVYRQVERYAKFDEVKAVILYTGHHMGITREINGKPAYIVKAGAAWL